jgi:predicted  nucleic acid-binding Zn-ribbon protein
VREPVEKLDKVASLRASFGDARARYKELKEQLCFASESMETAQLERKVKQAQNQMNTIASELQRLEQKD